ncbi:glutamyl-tRNA reductase [Denitratimonas sp. CY0512]|uniref:glutamyl-tRNA reductase n=1 Tax=Denitratimonas sp. CY0512 TaxID=3131940 RepID=UPI0030B31A71
MTLLALGLNHQTAPVSLREKLAITPSALSDVLGDLTKQQGVVEAAVLSTCNRTEIYCRVEAGAEHLPEHWLAQFGQLRPDQLDTYLYRHRDGEAVRHLFRVATGLDSMVLGEPQILGQVKEAWQAARASGALKTPLDRLFQQTFAVAKRARTDTRIGAHPVSVAFAAVRLAQRVFSALDQATVLLIGAGDTIELAARHLADHKVKRLLVANRTLEHAQALASRFGGVALPLDDLERHLAEADIVLSATASREPILRREAVKQALRQRRHRPMFLLDLAVPRDIEPAISELDDVFLYSVDDLEQVIDENRRSRREAAEQAEAIIELQVEHYLSWWRASGEQDTLKQLRQSGETIRDAVLARAGEMLAQGRSPQQALEYLAHTLTNKLLHAPSVALRQAAQQGDRELLHAAARLFDSSDRAASTDANPDSDDAQHPPQARRTG